MKYVILCVMAYNSNLKVFGGIITAVPGIAYFRGFFVAIINYSQISHWLGTSSRLGVIFVIVFQIWIWITGFVLLYLGYKSVTEGYRKKEKGTGD